MAGVLGADEEMQARDFLRRVTVAGDKLLLATPAATAQNRSFRTPKCAGYNALA